LLFVLVYATRGAETSIAAEYLELTGNLLIAILLGLAAGLVTRYFCGIVLPTRWLVLLTAVIALLMGICELLHVPYLLTILTMGITVSSTSDLADKINAALD